MTDTDYRTIADDLISDLKDEIRAILLTRSTNGVNAGDAADDILKLNARIEAVKQGIDLVAPKKPGVSMAFGTSK